jgi:hypothetical protein
VPEMMVARALLAAACCSATATAYMMPAGLAVRKGRMSVAVLAADGGAAPPPSDVFVFGLGYTGLEVAR